MGGNLARFKAAVNAKEGWGTVSQIAREEGLNSDRGLMDWALNSLGEGGGTFSQVSKDTSQAQADLTQNLKNQQTLTKIAVGVGATALTLGAAAELGAFSGAATSIGSGVTTGAGSTSLAIGGSAPIALTSGGVPLASTATAGSLFGAPTAWGGAISGLSGALTSTPEFMAAASSPAFGGALQSSPSWLSGFGKVAGAVAQGGVNVISGAGKLATGAVDFAAALGSGVGKAATGTADVINAIKGTATKARDDVRGALAAAAPTIPPNFNFPYLPSWLGGPGGGSGTPGAGGVNVNVASPDSKPATGETSILAGMSPVIIFLLVGVGLYLLFGKKK